MPRGRCLLRDTQKDPPGKGKASLAVEVAWNKGFRDPRGDEQQWGYLGCERRRRGGDVGDEQQPPRLCRCPLPRRTPAC